MALVLAVAGTRGIPGPASTRSATQRRVTVLAAGISWTSSGGCSDRNNSTCTSFEGIRQATIDGAITLKNASGCSLLITGGTETGHADGTYSHCERLQARLLAYHVPDVVDPQHLHLHRPAQRRCARSTEAASGNIYADEGNHWDVLYYTCGC